MIWLFHTLCISAKVALSGGVGTLDEIFTVAASHTIGYHHKMVVLYNMKGFWNSTIAMLDDMQAKGMVRGDWHDYNLLKAKGYDDKFVFLEDVKTLKAFMNDIGFELSPNVLFSKKYEKGIIVSGTPIHWHQRRRNASRRQPLHQQVCEGDRTEDHTRPSTVPRRLLSDGQKGQGPLA